MEDIMINFLTYRIEEMKYNLNDNYDDTRKEETALYNISLEAALADDDDSMGKVSLTFSTLEEGNVLPFDLELKMSAFYQVERQISKTDFMEFLKINGSAHLFPFFRSAIADVTKTANIKPLILPLVNVYELLKHQEK